MSGLVVQHVTIHPLSIPLRQKVSHAAAQRTMVDPVVVAVELRDGTIGYGETLPRIYVTGESVASTVADIQAMFIPALLEFHPATFGEALEAIEGLPWTDANGRSIPAARAAVELAMLDAVMRSSKRDIEAVVQWMGLPGFGRPGSLPAIRFSGVVAQLDIDAAFRQLRHMYWGGIRQFKMKVGVPGDIDLVRRAAAYLRKPIERGRASLRVDANGAWNVEQLERWLAETADLPIAAIEQPLGKSVTDQLTRVRSTNTPIWMHDESLILMEDARRWIELGIAGGFSIRLSKCGGMIPSLRLAALARRENVRIQLGCMVGETSLLSAAGLRFLEVCTGVAWAEGCYGSFLMGDDVMARGLRFGFGGRPPKMRQEPGLSPAVDPGKLKQLCSTEPIRTVL